ncbi:rod shape-determining protein MreC [Bacterioplanes sanyensis]|uniref:rod shape-determining protein MreC n=1 Tax=Bacterioplanes sanyensis TaxID=1249553 RepID=UPI0022B8B800|nr:rod shape-determining protein MreC [Bacterioplanes sanyensis]
MALALALMWVDHHYSWLQPARMVSGYLLEPAQTTAMVPSALVNWFGESAATRQELLHANKQLSARNLILETRVQRLAALEAENIELRELLNASEKLGSRVLVSSVLAVDPDPYSQQIFINKGSEDDVFVGQPVLDAYGLLGQVIDVLPRRSRVLMIADSNHAIPVQVNRNGVRAIAAGTGALDSLELIYVPNTADIEVGDLLISSGLGGRYPKGYPVATVTQVENIAGKPFASVTAKPSAHLDRSRHLLLLFSDTQPQTPAEFTAEQPK